MPGTHLMCSSCKHAFSPQEQTRDSLKFQKKKRFQYGYWVLNAALIYYFNLSALPAIVDTAEKYYICLFPEHILLEAASTFLIYSVPSYPLTIQRNECRMHLSSLTHKETKHGDSFLIKLIYSLVKYLSMIPRCLPIGHKKT